MKTFKKSVVLFLAVCMMFLFCSCDKTSKLVGNWTLDKENSFDEHQYPYCAEQLIFREDGTGVMDAMSMTWSEKDGTISTVSQFAPTFENLEYEFKGSKLYLDGYCYEKN